MRAIATSNAEQIDLSLPVEEGDPATDDRMFRRCLGQYGTGIAIITAEVDGQRAAVTVNSFSSVSLDPPLILWSIARTSRSFQVFNGGVRFAVNILSSRQMDVSRHFSSKLEDKFADSTWSPGSYGSPLIDGCLAHLECETHSLVDGGDHVIVVGLVKRAVRFEGTPLLFSQGQYSVAETHPETSPAPETTGQMPDSTPQSTIVSQIFEAHNLLSSIFDEHRRAEGVDLAVARVLACLYDTEGLKTEQLAAAAYLGQRDTEDAIAELGRRSLLMNSGGMFLLTPAGRQVREAIWERWQDFQQAQIEGIPATDLQTTIRTLSRLIDQNKVERS